MRVIEWGELEELKAKYGNQAVSDLPILPLSSITNPSLLIKAKSIALQKDFREKEI